MTEEHSEAVHANGWRQGDILPTSAHAKLAKLIKREWNDNDVCIVITHSCELIRPDTTVEIVIGQPTGGTKLNSTLTNGQSRKKIEVNTSINGRHIPIVITAADRYNIPTELLTFARPDERKLTDDLQREALVEWLVAKYARPGFPDNFEARLSPQLKEIKKIISQSAHIWRIYLGLSSWGDLSENETYEVELYFVIEDAHYQQTKIRGEVLIFVNKFISIINRCNGLQVSQDATEMLVSDEEFPIACERKFRRRERFDHVSLAYADHIRDKQ